MEPAAAPRRWRSGRVTDEPGARDVGFGLPLGGEGTSAFAEADLARLSPAALVAMRALAICWALTDEEAVRLFGVAEVAWREVRGRGHPELLSPDQMLRVSALLGVHAALHALFADGMADRWVRLANAGPLFGGRTPVAVMAERGVAGMLEVRRHVEALRLGL